MNLKPEKIFSTRLHFRKLSIEDAPAWVEFLSNAEALKFFAPITNVKQFAVDWMERTMNRYTTDGFGLFALIENIEFITVAGHNMAPLAEKAFNHLRTVVPKTLRMGVK